MELDLKKSSLILITILLLGFSSSSIATSATSITPPYILIGGETGTWFTPNQSPIFLQMSMSSGNEVANLTTGLPTPSSGSIWTGASNSSQWLVSGFCCSSGNLHSPQINLYDQSLNSVSFNNSLIESKMSSWWGGDIFTASFGGKGNWLVGGLGSGCLPSFQPGCSSNQGGATGCGNQVCDNHMALGLFNGSNFIDLSGAKGFEKHQADFIIYASAWNGHYWLVGGGYLSSGILFKYTPITGAFSFLTTLLQSATKVQGAVTSIAWNGKDWLIGGMGFLAEYTGKSFISLTNNLNSVLSSSQQLNYPNSVNKIIWNTQSSLWLLGGGLPISITGSGQSWWHRISRSTMRNSKRSTRFPRMSSPLELLPSYL